MPVVPDASFAIAVNPHTQQVYIANIYTETVSILDGNAFLTPAQRAQAVQQDSPDGTPLPSVDVPPFVEDFSTGTLDLTRWGVMQNLPGPGGVIDIVGTDPTDRRLRLGIYKPAEPHTRVHGIYTREAIIDFEHARTTEIHVDIDWSQITDGRDGLRAGILISPTICTRDFQAEAHNFLQVMYYGNLDNPTHAHLEVRARIRNEWAEDGHRGGSYTLFDEGYHASYMANRPLVGRTLGVQQLRILVSAQALAVWENGILRYEQRFTQLAGLASELPWLNGHLYLVQTGGENEPASDVFFSNLSVRQAPELPKPE